MDIKKILKKYGKEFASIYDEALKELDASKEDELLNLQKYLDKHVNTNMNILHIDFDKEETKKHAFYRKLNVPKEKIEIYTKLYRNFILVEDVYELNEYDLIVMFDLSKESLDKRILNKINQAVFQLKRKLIEDNTITEEEIEMHMDSIYEEAKEIVCNDPMSFIIKYPISTFISVKDNMIYYRMKKQSKYIMKKKTTDMVYLKLINKRHILLMNIAD